MIAFGCRCLPSRRVWVVYIKQLIRNWHFDDGKKPAQKDKPNQKDHDLQSSRREQPNQSQVTCANRRIQQYRDQIHKIDEGGGRYTILNLPLRYDAEVLVEERLVRYYIDHECWDEKWEGEYNCCYFYARFVVAHFLFVFWGFYINCKCRMYRGEGW